MSRTECRGFSKEHQGSIAQVCPRRPRYRRPETEQGSAVCVVAGPVVRPAAVHTLSQVEDASANMGPLEKAQGDLRQKGRVGIGGKPGRYGEQSPRIVGAVAALRPRMIQLCVFEDPKRIGQVGQVAQSR